MFKLCFHTHSSNIGLAVTAVTVTALLNVIKTLINIYNIVSILSRYSGQKKPNTSVYVLNPVRRDIFFLNP